MPKCKECGYASNYVFCPCGWLKAQPKDCLDSRYKFATLDDFSKELVLKIVPIAVKSRSLLLHGPSGTGKTHMAIALSKYLSYKFGGFNVVYDPPTLPSTLNRWVDDNLHLGILIFDELHNVHAPYVFQRVAKSPGITIATTNLLLEALDGRLHGWRATAIDFSNLNPFTNTLSIEKRIQKEEDFKKWEKFYNPNVSVNTSWEKSTLIASYRAKKRNKLI